MQPIFFKGSYAAGKKTSQKYEKERVVFFNPVAGGRGESVFREEVTRLLLAAVACEGEC